MKVLLLAQPWAGFPYLTAVAKLAGFAGYITIRESEFEEEGLFSLDLQHSSSHM